MQVANVCSYKLGAIPSLRTYIHTLLEFTISTLIILKSNLYHIHKHICHAFTKIYGENFLSVLMGRNNKKSVRYGRTWRIVPLQRL